MRKDNNINTHSLKSSDMKGYKGQAGPSVSIRLDLTRTVARELFTNSEMPWGAVFSLKKYIAVIGSELSHDQYDEIKPCVWVHTSAFLSPTAKISSPAIICGGAVISHFSHVEASIIGAFSHIGESASVKNSILFDKSRLCGHNSINSSILGYQAVLGNGVMIPDTRLDGLNVSIDMPNGVYLLSVSHFGAVVCDGARVGAGAVLHPGTVIDTCATVDPLCSVSGYVYPYTDVKFR